MKNVIFGSTLKIRIMTEKVTAIFLSTLRITVNVWIQDEFISEIRRGPLLKYMLLNCRSLHPTRGYSEMGRQLHQ